MVELRGHWMVELRGHWMVAKKVGVEVVVEEV